MFSSAGEIKRFAPLQDHAAAERVILVHGLLMSGHVMLLLARYLARQGFASILYDYPTRRATVDEHGACFAAFIEKEISGQADSPGQVHFVTHSMGGLLLRSALRKLSPAAWAKIGRIVMIAPPNKGSDVAEYVLKNLSFAGKIVKCLPDLSSVPHSFANTFPEPDSGFDIGIIGGRYDLDVRESSTHLTHERDHLMLPHAHTTLLFSRRNRRGISSSMEDLNVLKKKKEKNKNVRYCDHSCDGPGGVV